MLFALPASVQAVTSPEVICEFTDPRLTEISGMAPSTLHRGVMWVHNDSGDEARLYALQLSDCSVVAELTLRDVSARDFEGLAAGVDPQGRAVLWVGDIGDNRDSWSEVSIYRIREPKKLGTKSAQVQRYRFTYEDGPHNAETIMADPASQQIWIVTKAMAGGSIYALPKKLKKSGINTAKRIGSTGGLITDGAMNPDGSGFVLRDYFAAKFFNGTPVGILVEGSQLPAQRQGEAIAWLPGENAVVIASEGDNRLLRVPAPAAAVPANSDQKEQERETNHWVRLGVIVGVIVIVGVMVLVTGLNRIRNRAGSKTTGSIKKAV